MANSPKLSVLVVDAQPVARLGLVQLINSQDRLHVCGETGDAPTARALCAQLRPAMAVVDIAGADGLNLVKEFSHWTPGIRIVAFTGIEDALSVQRAFQAGALAYVTRHDPVSELLTALLRASEGQRHVAPRVSHMLLDRLACGAVEMVGSEEAMLSNRELEIFHAIGRGLSTRTIAGELHVSVKTVETHRQRIKEKLHLRDGCDLQKRAVLFHHAAAA